MRNLSTWTSLALAGAVALGGSASGQALSLDMVGGGLGQTLTIGLSGPPGAQYLLLMSLNTGPTALPAPHITPLDVGFDLLDLSVTIPGFLGVLPGGGAVALPLPVPNLPILDNLNVNFQGVRIDSGATIVEKSNLYRVTFDTPGQFLLTLGNMAAGRAFATATKLADGTVLVAGGGQGSITSATGLNSAEIYKPNLEAFQNTGTMNSARALHRAVLLQNGRVFIVGGVDGSGVPLATAEVYDPITKVFTATGNMPVARVGHTATLLPDGRVLVAGGSSDLTDATAFITSAQSSTVIFNPATNSFANGPSLNQPKTFHDAVALADGRVLVTGGLTYTLFLGIPIPDFSDRAQIYNQSTNSFSGTVTMPQKRAAHSSILLDDGRALLVGGANGSVLAPSLVAGSALFAPATTSFSNAAALASATAIPSLVKLADGRVLSCGGAQGDLTNPVPINVCQVFTPNAGSGTWANPFGMSSTRSGHPGVLLNDLTAVFFGGGGGPSNTALNSAEVFQP